MTDKKMNDSRLQYWLYATLKAKFGTEVTMERDPLHNRYEVNRHGFKVNTENLDINQVYKNFVSELKSAGFTQNDTDSDNGVNLIKQVEHDNTIQDITISVSLNKSVRGEYIDVYPRVYNKEKTNKPKMK